MATVPQTKQLGEVWPTLATSGTIPPEILQRGMSNLGKINYLTKEMAVFSHFIYERFGSPHKKVQTREYPIAEISELDRTLTVRVGSDDITYGVATRIKFGLSNYQAAQIQPSDILYRKDGYIGIIGTDMVSGQVYAATSGSQGTNIGPDLGWDVGINPTKIIFSKIFGPSIDGIYTCVPEPMQVVAVGDVNSAGTGFTLITVKRCYKGPGARDKGGNMINQSLVVGSSGIIGTTNGGTGDTTNGDNATIKVNDVLLIGAPTFKEGTGLPNGVFKNVEIDRNFSQELKYAVEHTNEMEIEKQWISESPLDINRWLVAKRKMRQLEMLTIFGQKGVERDALGKVTYTMGGILEFILQDADHYLTYTNPSLSWDGLLMFSKNIATLGGSNEKFLFCGYSLDAMLRVMFYQSGFMRFEPALTKEFNVEVNAIVGEGVKLNIVSSQILEEAGFGMRAIGLDLGFPSFVPVTHQDWDMKYRKNVGPPDVEVYKEGLISIVGLERRYQPFHFIADFSNAR